MRSRFTAFRNHNAGAAVVALVVAALAPVPAVATPTLATERQLATEVRVLRILKHPVVLAAAARERQVLLTDPAAQVPDGREHLDRALGLWVTSLAFAVTSYNPSDPAMLWASEDTPRTWFGHILPGGGVAGDNPDNIYLGAYVDGASRYTLAGRIPLNGPSNLTVEVFKGRPGRLGEAQTPAGKPHADLGNQVRMFQRADLRADAAGRFTITLGPDPANGRPTHVETPPEPLSITVRNTLGDWRQAPIEIAIRKTGGAAAAPPRSDDEIAAEIAAALPGYVAQWTTFKEHYLGPPPVNRLAGALPRDGGWGYLAGGAFDLKEDEALVVTTGSNGAAYTGFQLLDRWFLSADTRKAFTSLNNGQAVHSADGTTTYIVALHDPGYANWLDTSGSPHGFANLRWQGLPQGANGNGLLRSVRLVKLVDLPSALPAAFPKVSPAERVAALKARRADYESRLSAEAR